ncbi:unnamed protein product [Lymnaea stagnalis]|uniref:CobW/HypB/UreG nucleotide-binding domain-containing protein n=1 Tax=Lymnaea stagnalis TaxID=6523 RepID=A0AAV2HCE1_LYMST
MAENTSENVKFLKGGPFTSHDHGHGHGNGGFSHSHDHVQSHSHDLVQSHSHGHTHDVLEGPGTYTDRDQPIYRSDWDKRAFTVGIGGPVGSGKTALVLALCQYLGDNFGICVVTNDIFTKEDWQFLVEHKALEAERLRAVETGGCPHAAIREDYSLNIAEVRDLTELFHPDIVLLESGGDNLAANFSRELADYIIYVIDVAGGDKIPRKGGPGVTQSDLLVINKTDLADAVGASLARMEQDAKCMRQDGPTVFIQAKHGLGIPEVAEFIVQTLKTQRGES